MALKISSSLAENLHDGVGHESKYSAEKRTDDISTRRSHPIKQSARTGEMSSVPFSAQAVRN